MAQSAGSRTSTAITAGIAIAALIVGALLALGALWGYKKYKIKHPTPLFSPVDEPNFVPTPYASSYLDRSTSIRDGRDRGASLLGHSSYARVGLTDGGEDEARSPPPGSHAFSPTSGRATMGGYSDPYNPRASDMGSSSWGGSDLKGGKDRRKHGNAAESDEEMELGQRRAAGQRGEREGLMGRNVFVVHHVSPIVIVSVSESLNDRPAEIGRAHV